MTDNRKNAKKEIKFIKNIDAKLQATKHSANDITKLPTTKQLVIFNTGYDKASHFKDVDGNNIGDFYYDNAVDNHKLLHCPSKKDFHLMMVDEIKAIKSDTQTLLNE